MDGTDTHRDSGIRIDVAPERGRIDEPLAIRVSGLAPEQQVIIRAMMPGPPGHCWESWVAVGADETGSVDLTSTCPQDGTYQTTDPMGLIWSMMLITHEDKAFVVPPSTRTSIPITLTVECEGQLVAQRQVERLRVADGVRRTEVREAGLVGVLYEPPAPQPYPGILLLGGAEGGLHEADAALLASHGYAVLALAYFGVEGVPADLVSIPLEYFENAIHWLQAREHVRPDVLGVLGGSRGGELALLLGSIFQQVTAVVSYNGSGLITQGIAGNSILERVSTDLPSWTFNDQPLPYLPSRAIPAVEAQVRNGEPIELGMVFEHALETARPEVIAAATIPVERIRGPVLLISAGDDRTWPTVTLSDIATRRLEHHHHRYPFHHLTFPQAGHGIIPPPYGPTTMQVVPLPGGSMRLGGTPQDDAAARAAAWHHTRSFFSQHLREPAREADHAEYF